MSHMMAISLLASALFLAIGLCIFLASVVKMQSKHIIFLQDKINSEEDECGD